MVPSGRRGAPADHRRCTACRRGPTRGRPDCGAARRSQDLRRRRAATGRSSRCRPGDQGDVVERTDSEDLVRRQRGDVEAPVAAVAPAPWPGAPRRRKRGDGARRSTLRTLPCWGPRRSPSRRRSRRRPAACHPRRSSLCSSSPGSGSRRTAGGSSAFERAHGGPEPRLPPRAVAEEEHLSGRVVDVVDVEAPAAEALAARVPRADDAAPHACVTCDGPSGPSPRDAEV